MTYYRKATVCTATVQKGYSTAGQCSPVACQQELTLQRQHAPPLRMSAAADSMLTGRHKTKSRRRIRTETDEEDLRI
jgi:hypothetical protein